MLVICPRYNSYSILRPELRMRVKQHILETVDKYSFGGKPTVCLEDELAIRLFGSNSDIITITQKVDLPVVKITDYLDLYSDEFASRYESVKLFKPFNKEFSTLLPHNFKDRDSYFIARRKQYRERLQEILYDCVDKHHVIIQFVTDNSINSWVPKLEQTLGDGRAIITINLNDLTTSCYYGGVYLSETDMLTVVKQIIGR